MKQLKYFLPLFIFSLSAFAQKTMPKKYQSLLWEISGNGLKKTSYLYGTMHVSDKLVFNLPDSFFVAIKGVEAVALEVDMDSWMDDIMLMQEAEKNLNTTSYIYRPSAFYRNAFALDAPSEEDLKSLLQFSPNISNRIMYRSSKQNSDYQEDNYLDVFIFQAGKKMNKKVLGLENFKQTEMLSNKADNEENNFTEEQKKEREELQEQKRLKLKELRGDKPYYDVLDDAYRKGDLDLLDSLSKLSADEGFLKYMLYERNKIMAQRMDSIMRKTSLFTGVGAAHLPGQKGVIELLRELGYTVRAVNTTKSDIKTKTQIDETRFPTKFKTQFSPDSVFAVSVPGKLYEIPQDGSFRYYLFNDVSNGSYYCIQRMNHYGKLLDQSQEHIMKRIDSLIFENIPGKLLSKKEIKNNNGYPGYDILNKTAKGDIQRHQIFITPTEIYSFKMSGIQEYVKKGTEAETFFNSIVFYEPSVKETIHHSKFGYSLSMPANKVFSEQNSRSQNSMLNEIVNAVDKSNNEYLLAMASSLYDFDYIEEDSFELNMLAERFALLTNKKITSRQIFIRDNNPIISFGMETKNKPEQKFYAQVIISGADYFLLCSNTDSTKANKYFRTFKQTNKTYSIPYTTITDTTLFFNVTAQELKNDYTDLLLQEQKLNNKTKKEKDEAIKKIFLPVKEIKIYVSPETKEKVMVEYRKFSMYFQQESMETFWKGRIKTHSENYKMKVSHENTTKKGNYYEYNLLLTDTGSTRGIVVKMIQRCGTIYTIKTVIDTTLGLTGFTKKFFESFTPKDTCMGIDIVSNKLDNYFFSKLYATDTNESKKAKAAIEYVQANMLPANVPALIKTINDKEFRSLSSANKKELIACFEGVKSKETIPFLEKLYAQYSDSVEIELAILRALAKLKTTEATKTFLKLLKTDVPVSANEYTISNIFTIFADSAQNAQVLFPELIKYTKYPEYKNAIYKLMTTVYDARQLKPKVYSKLVSDILLDANYELKKYISDKDRDKEAYRYSYTKNETAYDELNARQQKLYCYTAVLSPHYKNPDVKKFFTKTIASTSSDKFKAVLYAQLLAAGENIYDSIINKFAASASSRMVLYKALKKQNKLNLFDKNYLNQKDLVISQLYGSSETFKKDTIVLLSATKVEFNQKPGYVYIFKTRPKDKKIWKLGYSGVHPEDNTTFNYKPTFTKIAFSFDSETQMQKEIDTLMRKIRVENRKRASVKDFEKDVANDYNSYW